MQRVVREISDRRGTPYLYQVRFHTRSGMIAIKELKHENNVFN